MIRIISSIPLKLSGTEKDFFSFIPQPNRKYFAIIEREDGTEQKFPLPEAKTEGLSLAISSHFKQPYWRIKITNSDSSNPNQSLFLLGMQNGNPITALKIDLENGQSTTVQIDKSKYNTGIVQVTLFDAQKIPRSERLVYLNKEEQIELKINELSLPQTPRGKVELELQVNDKTGRPVQGDFALSVTDPGRIPEFAYQSPSIDQYLALYADLPFQPENLNLDQNSGEAQMKLELLMLTHGWRRYNWQEVLADTVPLPNYFVEPGIYVQGTLRSDSKKKQNPCKSRGNDDYRRK